MGGAGGAIPNRYGGKKKARDRQKGVGICARLQRLLSVAEKPRCYYSSMEMSDRPPNPDEDV